MKQSLEVYELWKAKINVNLILKRFYIPIVLTFITFEAFICNVLVFARSIGSRASEMIKQWVS